MFLLSLARVIKFSLQDIFRNIWLSIATITILILALFSVNLLITVNVVSEASINAVKEKIDVNIFIKSEAEEDGIMALKAKISNLPQVREVRYISKTEALETFKEKQKNNPEVIEALKELGKNPLTPSLIIKPKSIDEYDALISSLNKIEDDVIESRNFDDHKKMLTKINLISEKVKEVGLIVSSIFIIISLLVVYNAIRVAIYTHRKEIAVMKLVGASNTFIKSPFLVSSVVYSFISVVIIVLLYYPFLSLLQPYLEAFFTDYSINIVSYFNANFIKIFGLEFLGVAIINIAASVFAVGRYSKV